MCTFTENLAFMHHEFSINKQGFFGTVGRTEEARHHNEACIVS